MYIPEYVKASIQEAIIWGVIILVCISTIFVPRKISVLLLGILFFVFICYFDNSFIRNFLLKKLPKKSSLRKDYAMREIEDYKQETYKTITYFFLLAYFCFLPIRFITLLGCVIFPILSVIRYMKHLDTIHFGNIDDGEFNPTLMTLLPAGVGFVLHVMDQNMEYSKHFWILLVICALGVIIPFLITGKKHKVNEKDITGFSICIFVFMFSMLSSINIMYDFSKGQEYPVEIVNKDARGTRGRRYYATISPWGDNQEPTELQITSDEYWELEIGDQVYVHQQEGLLKMEWHYIELK